MALGVLREFSMQAKMRFGAATALLMMLAPAAFAQPSDQPGDASTQARLSAGETVDGAITPAGDADWFRLSVERGMRYALTLEGVAGEDGVVIDPTLGVYDSEGVQLAFNDDAGGTLNSALQYTAAQSGEVFIEARGFLDEATGAYRLGVTASVAPPDDVGNDAATRGRVAAGRSVTGNIESEGDVDWFRLRARNNQSYRIAITGGQDEGALNDPLLRVIDRDGNELAVADDTDGSLNPALTWRPQSNGEVFLEASGFASAHTGRYTLSVEAERAPTDGTSGDVYTQGRIAPGRAVNASLDFAGDRDWYRVRLDEGQSYRFTLTSADVESGVSDPLVKIFNDDGVELAMDDDGGDGLNAYLEFTAPTSGAYYVEARAFSDDATGGYVLAAHAGDVPDGSSTDAALSADGDYREAMLAPAGDHDWYRLDLAEGQAVRVGMTSADTSDALGDPLIAIHGPDSVEIMRDDDGGEGLNAWLEFIAPAAGAYYVAAQGFVEDAQGRYILSITAGEIGGSPDSAEYLAPNSEGRVSLITSGDDADWYAIELVEGRPYRFNLEGAYPGPLADPYLTLYDAEGNQIAADDDGGAGVNSYLTFSSTTGGPHFAAVTGYGGTTGRYSLRVSDTDVPGSTGTDEVLQANGDDRVSRIDAPGDLDTYLVELEAGARYVIEVNGHGDHPLADPFLAVLNMNNERVISDDDSGDGPDARLRFAPEESGPFFLQASGLGGSTGGYQISIVRQ